MSLVWIYLGVIFILFVMYFVFYKHWTKITQGLIKQIDNLLFLYDKNIYQHKDTIYDYDTTKTLLFHNQVAFFAKGTKYTDITVSLIQDMEYLTTLLQKEVVPESTIKIIKATYITRQKINTLKEYTHTILIILTLGIAKLLLP